MLNVPCTDNFILITVIFEELACPFWCEQTSKKLLRVASSGTSAWNAATRCVEVTLVEGLRNLWSIKPSAFGGMGRRKRVNPIHHGNLSQRRSAPFPQTRPGAGPTKICRQAQGPCASRTAVTRGCFRRPTSRSQRAGSFRVVFVALTPQQRTLGYFSKAHSTWTFSPHGYLTSLLATISLCVSGSDANHWKSVARHTTRLLNFSLSCIRLRNHLDKFWRSIKPRFTQASTEWAIGARREGM